MIKKSLTTFVIMLMLSLVCLADNPFDDGLDFVSCPPQQADLKLPKFPEFFEKDCKLIRWAWDLPIPDGERMMWVKIEGFRKDPTTCGVYLGKVRFFDQATNVEWYRGQLKFYYTRNYIHTSSSIFGLKEKNIAFRFVVKGDIERVSDNIPGGLWLILCTRRAANVKSYKKIFVYGGLDLIFDMKAHDMKGFMLSLGHNDGWYTHHPDCSQRPISWLGMGDIIGHYCERGWLFVSPGWSFVFNPNLRPPTGRFTEEAFREVGQPCFTEEAVEFGTFNLMPILHIHSYQVLRAISVCNNEVRSTQFCQGMVYSGIKYPWITFFSMGYWRDFTGRPNTILHLVEGNIKMASRKFVKKFGNEQYFYGFATKNPSSGLKLVDLASNETAIGVPKNTRLLLYFYNAGLRLRLNPIVRPSLLGPKLQYKIMREVQKVTKDKKECPFLTGGDKQKKK